MINDPSIIEWNTNKIFREMVQLAALRQNADMPTLIAQIVPWCKLTPAQIEEAIKQEIAYISHGAQE
jgi:hypothetical protein